ncbi:CRE-SCRT-1 protein [Caenorhabditis remanei]|uniref:CRE-SCRT-1 protein n=1 Tax=Caenorhabditis remanei TaxID=31234 RepID=E3MYI3_CAERE|nr:CRE-SCRT-1 protein [Caenorhabditis remanei]
MSKQFEIPPFPVVTTPFLLRYLSALFDAAQRKYNTQVEFIAVPYLPDVTFSFPPPPPTLQHAIQMLSDDESSPSVSPSTTVATYSTPSSPDRKAKTKFGSYPPVGLKSFIPLLYLTVFQACQCKVCGKEFSRQWLLQGHLRTHSKFIFIIVNLIFCFFFSAGEKPFQCEICCKRFADKSNLRAHVQTHSGTKPHKCSRCGKSFALKSYLSKHEESKCLVRQ